MITGGKKEVIKLAWPLVLGMLSFTMLGVTDTLLMGRVNTEAQAGVGLATVLFHVFLSFFMGLIVGPQTLVAAADGAGDKKQIRMAGSTGLLLALLCGLAMALLLGLIHGPLLLWTLKEEGVLQSAQNYLKVRLLGMPFTIMGLGLLAGIQGLGDTRTRMWVSFIGNGINICLDFIFIFGWGPIPAMEEAGAALATVIGAVVMVALYARRYLKLLGKPVFPDRDIIFRAVKVGLPSAMNHLLGVLSFTTMSLVLARVGAVHLAANQIVLNIVSVSFLPGWGLGEASGILVGRYLGAGQKDPAARSIQSARTIAVLFMGACGVLFLLRGQWLASFFTLDPEVAKLSGTLMIYAAVFQIFDAMTMVHIGALQGAGDTRFTLIACTITGWGITVPAALILGLWMGWGAPGAYLGLTLEIMILAFITGWRVRGVGNGKVGRMDLLLGKECRAT